MTTTTMSETINYRHMCKEEYKYLILSVVGVISIIKYGQRFIDTHSIIYAYMVYNTFQQSSKEVDAEIRTILGAMVSSGQCRCHCSTANHLSISSFVVSAIFHEFGHAMSCLQLKNRINNIGLYIFFVIPGAYVDVNLDDLYRTPFWNQLKIYTAGVWHNLVLALFVSFIVLPSLPLLVSPIYRYSDTELYVTNVALTSPLSNKIFPGDHIISINDCPVTNQHDYIQCIYKVIDTKEQYCLRHDIHSCINETLNIRECLKNDKLTLIKKCTTTCDQPQYDCTEIYDYNYYIFKITVQSIGYNRPEELTFLGTPEELWNSYSTNNYISRFESLRSKDIPFILYTILNFVSAISLGLGAMNVLPIRFMDGQHIVDALVMTFLRSRSLEREDEDRIFEKSTKIIGTVTTILLLVNIIIATYYIFEGL
ncbi:membrane-bound transcription factor peptidase [Cavenderia fasciculata]|uniref:Endopeptidase S2P n=1 Tax=Cavenderia fasciculata TaxID=261658 RepID=F4PTD0_CACFS|nr:membrane-bound transcription factor peptidase [Cavenderia fasciculata]EGG21652.1 membrane-bound transcription factor peptidase [Cavenderia fasciculata]|eukprot:XP_004359502.1 membrane-bound transcription factor peptidase [Cavenderia fasciculata]